MDHRKLLIMDKKCNFYDCYYNDRSCVVIISRLYEYFVLDPIDFHILRHLYYYKELVQLILYEYYVLVQPMRF